MVPEFSIEVQANESGYLAELDYGKLQIAPMEGMGFTPGQLLVSSTAACGGSVFGMIATKMHLPIQAVRIEANAKRNLEQAISLVFKNCPTIEIVER